jgi:hypothetical protein
VLLDGTSPPSNLATTALPRTRHKPAKGNIGSVMADVVSVKSSESPLATKF